MSSWLSRAVFGACTLAFALTGCDAANDLDASSTSAPTAAASAPTDEADTVIPGQYIVVVSEQPADAARQASLAALLAETNARTGTAVTHTYEAALTGFAARLSDAAVEALRADPRVAYVEQDHVARLTGPGSQTGATWGLDRIDARSGRDGSYSWNTSGEGVTAYVIDSGVRISHAEFGGRASYGYDVLDNDPIADDCNGHGTHVAGTIGGTTYGVAKDVDLVAVRAFNCAGSSSASTILAGINWTTANATLPAVANMSFSTSSGAALEAAMGNLLGLGVQATVAAGNGFLGLFSLNACNTAPAYIPDVITVSATDLNDRKASWANYGSCVDFFAPGVDVTSAWNANDGATNTISGTSMAAPHAAGVAALYLEANPSATPLQVRDALYDASTRNVVTNHQNTPNNHLLYSLLDGTPPPTGITLAGSAEILGNGRWRATLTWTGASGSQVDVLANGSPVATTANDGAWTITVNPQPTNVFDVEVCEAGTSTCSNTVTLTF